MKKTKVRIAFRMIAVLILILIFFTVVTTNSWKTIVHLPFALLMTCAVMGYDPFHNEK